MHLSTVLFFPGADKTRSVSVRPKREMRSISSVGAVNRKTRSVSCFGYFYSSALYTSLLGIPLSFATRFMASFLSSP